MRSAAWTALLLAATALLGSCGRLSHVSDGAPATRQALPVAGAGLRGEIAAAVRSYEAAVNARDLNALLACAGPDSTLRASLRARYAGPLTLDSLRCVERLGAVYGRGGSAEAVVCEQASWVEHGRRQAEYGWRTRRYERQGARWRLVADAERPYAETRFDDLAITLAPDQGTLSGRSRLSVGLTAHGEDLLVLRLNRGLEIERLADAAGRPVAFERVGDVFTVPCSGAAGDSLVLAIEFAGALFNESREVGYSQVGIGPEGSFASWVTSWYPHVAGTGSKARGRIAYTVPAGVTVASSGRLLASQEGPQVFAVDAPLDFSFAAARYFHASRLVDGIDVGVYFLQGGEAKAQLYIDQCARILAFLHEVYGSYPFDGYAVVEVPSDAVGGLGGSSEQGMNLFPAGGLPDDKFPLPLLSHEIGHSWWGNLVLSDGASILDEGLAQMTAVLCVDELAGPRVMRRFLRRGLPLYPQSAEDYFLRFAGKPGKDLPLVSVAAGAEDGMTLHDLADTKGFFVYQMLRDEIGDDAFRRSLRAAARAYARKVITLPDLRAVFERESGRDLGWFFSQWFERAGVPDFRMTSAITPAGGRGFEVSGEVTQSGAPYRATAEIVLASAGVAPRVEKLAVAGPRTPFRLSTDARPDTVLFDPDYKLLRWTDAYRHLGLLAAARVRHSAGEADSARAVLAAFLAQAPASTSGRCWQGLWKLEGGDLDGAARELGAVVGSVRLYDFDDPAVTRAEVGLGKIADLGGRRDEAVAWYRKAQARGDDPQALADAATCLAAPYTAAKGGPALTKEELERCTGTYAVDAGISMTVSLGASGRLTVVTGDKTFGIEPLGGGKFGVVGASDVTFEFAGEGAHCASVTVDMRGRIMHLPRKD